MTFQRHIATAAAAATALVGIISAPVQAATMFGNDGIKFDNTTEVEFTFNQSHGSFQSFLKVFEVVDGKVVNAPDWSTAKPVNDSVLHEEDKASDNGWYDDFVGTCGNTVVDCKNTFKFEGGKTYTLGLVSFIQQWYQTTVYSTSSLNNPSNPFAQQAQFNGGALADLLAGPVKITWDDTGADNDRDFNDFTVTAAQAVPEPATLGGLGLLAGLAFTRRRKVAQV